MEQERLKAILESLLFAAGEPVPLTRLAAVLDNLPRDDIRKALAEMVLAYADGSRGIVLEEVAGAYQLRTAREHALYVRKLLQSKPPRLSRPLLETLAIIAYRQPVTRPEIEQLRGVDTGGVLETLLERRLVRVAGRKEAPGRPIVYATTEDFLEIFGLKSLASLPDLDEFREVQDIAEAAGEDHGSHAANAPREPNPAEKASDAVEGSENAAHAGAPADDAARAGADQHTSDEPAADSDENPSRD